MSTANCLECGQSFELKIVSSGRRASRTTDWKRRKFCSRDCSARRVARTRNVVTFGDEANAEASHDLLKALVRYGWKHDGLPGLGPWEFRALAREIGVAG